MARYRMLITKDVDVRSFLVYDQEKAGLTRPKHARERGTDKEAAELAAWKEVVMRDGME